MAPDEIIALADEAVRDALEGTGRTRLKASDIVPEELIRLMRTPGHPHGAKLWELLPQDLRQKLNATSYITADLSQRLVNEINSRLSDSHFAGNLGVSGPSSSASAIERSRDHAALLARLFPGAVERVEPPDAHMMGYLSQFVIPRLVDRITKEHGGVTPEQLRAWRAIEPFVRDMQASTGAMPTAEEVYESYRRRLEERYGPVKAWWEAQIQRVQPQNPFKLKDPNAYRDAKQLLEAHGYDPASWQSSDSPYYLPKEALKPYSLLTIKRLLTTPGLGGGAPSPKDLWGQQAPPAAVEPQVPQWTEGLSGHGPDLFTLVTNQLYAAPQFGAERAVGEFMARTPNASPEQIEQYLNTLDQGVAEDIREIGWDSIAREVDSRVLEMIRDPASRADLARQLGVSMGVMTASVESLRRIIFGRGMRLLRRAFILRG